MKREAPQLIATYLTSFLKLAGEKELVLPAGSPKLQTGV